MKSYTVDLFTKDAKIADLGKLFMVYASLSKGAPIAGLTSIIGVGEKYFKKFSNGLPVTCHLSLNEQDLILEPRWDAKLLLDGIDKITIPYKDIIGVECIKDKLTSALNFPHKARMIYIKTVNGDFKILDVATFIKKNNAEEITMLLLQKSIGSQGKNLLP